jgi:hypothetical protein
MSIIQKLLKKKNVDYDSAGRNDKCPCGSGKKFKSCCWDRVRAKKREEILARTFPRSRG